MNNIVRILFLSSILVVTGCKTATQKVLMKEPDVITMEDALVYENKHNNVNNKSRDAVSGNEIIEWIQPRNKTEPCKIYNVTSNGTSDNEIEDKYQVFWDGDCKGGYAYGLGREFLKNTKLNLEWLATYDGGKAKPKYYMSSNKSLGATRIGDISSNYFVETTINESDIDINITHVAGYFSQDNKSNLVTIRTPFSDEIIRIKTYPNFVYRLTDNSNNETEVRRNIFEMLTKDGKLDGFGFTTNKAGSRNAVEFSNGRPIRKVLLPREYYKKAESIIDELIAAEEKALGASEEANQVLKQYKVRICKDSVNVSFMDDSEYKEICDTSKRNVRIGNKYKEKLARKRMFKEGVARIQEERKEYEKQQRIANEQARRQREADMARARQQREADKARAMNSLKQLGESMNQGSQRLLQSSQSFRAPQPSFGSNQNRNREFYNCNQIGNYMHCYQY